MKCLFDYHGFTRMMELSDAPKHYTIFFGPSLSSSLGSMDMKTFDPSATVNGRKVMFILYDKRMIDGEMIALYKSEDE